jgi:DNA-binding beta-propeller fold protein YncE
MRRETFPDKSSRSGLRRRIAAALLLLFIIVAGVFTWLWTLPPKSFASVVTLAGVGPKIKSDQLSDPFGVTVDEDDNIFVSDGRGGRIYHIGEDGRAELIIENLNMPSAVAAQRDGLLLVANTGAHTIVRIDPKNKSAEVIGGRTEASGLADGAANDARFNGPMGMAAGRDGAIFVADTYNDRIRVIRDGQVRTLAGGEQGFSDGTGAAARFDTPCGIAVAADGSLLVADTGNHRIRRVTMDGEVTTIAGTGEATERDGAPLEAAFDEPTAIAVRDAHSFYVADAAGNAVRLCDLRSEPDKAASVTTLAGGWPLGLSDGALTETKINRPTGLSVIPGWRNHALVFADSGNGLVRAFVTDGLRLGHHAKPETALINASEIRAAIAPRWPFNPPDAKREIAGTFGEVRGERAPDHDAWFHNGLDIPGGYGETVRAIFTERITRPLSVEDVGGTRERIRLPLIGYIHLRIGRDQNDKPLGNIDGLSFERDEKGHVIGVRVRRGARINAGDAIGTLNRLNHVHLIAGPTAGEVNALAALQLPGIADTIAPIIENVTLVNEQWQPFEAKVSRLQSAIRNLQLNGRVRIIVRAYDQADGNAGYRRLGIYKLSYTVLSAAGESAPGFTQPRENIVFEKLPATPNAAPLAFAEGSQSGYSGQTIFAYIVTNIVRDGEAREDFLDTSQLAPGDYLVRVIAADFFGNKTQRDMSVTVAR